MFFFSPLLAPFHTHTHTHSPPLSHSLSLSPFSAYLYLIFFFLSFKASLNYCACAPSMRKGCRVASARFLFLMNAKPVLFFRSPILSRLPPFSPLSSPFFLIFFYSLWLGVGLVERRWGVCSVLVRFSSGSPISDFPRAFLLLSFVTARKCHYR